VSRLAFVAAVLVALASARSTARDLALPEADVQPKRAASRSTKSDLAATGGKKRVARTVKPAKPREVNETLPEPLPQHELERLAAGLGADVAFFLRSGPQLGTGDGSSLEPLDLPQDYFVLLALPYGAAKPATRAVYRAFDERRGPLGYEARRRALLDALERVRRPRDLAALPPNDLVSSALADDFRALGAFRADVSGAGPTVYALFLHRPAAAVAKAAVEPRARTWITAPAWYG
jgi:4-diphosphocytidyl-2C-methyl-D-erythritol kinase